MTRIYNAVTLTTRKSENEANPEENEGDLPREWGLKRGVLMDLSETDEWGFSQRSQRSKVREWLYKCKPLMVVGPNIGVVVRATQDSPGELKRISAEHQKFMMGVVNIHRQG